MYWSNRDWLRRRSAGWFWTKRERASDLADLRGIGGAPIRVVEQDTGRVLGTVDPGAAHTTVHTGAVYVHQGTSYVVDSFEEAEGAAAGTSRRSRLHDICPRADRSAHRRS